MASLTRWTWNWVNSRSWWWTGRPGVLRFMGLRRVGHDWATELNWRTRILLSIIAWEVFVIWWIQLGMAKISFALACTFSLSETNRIKARINSRVFSSFIDYNYRKFQYPLYLHVFFYSHIIFLQAFSSFILYLPLGLSSSKRSFSRSAP